MFARCVCQRQSSPDFNEVEENTPSIPSAEAFFCMSSTIAESAVANKYQQIADEYEKETGIKVVIETAANNTYEQTLTAKMSTNEAPTIFQINGPKGYNNWKDYCADLSGTEIYKHLTDKDMAVTSNGAVYGIPYVVEGYGIIYNSAITDKYFVVYKSKIFL